MPTKSKSTKSTKSANKLGLSSFAVVWHTANYDDPNVTIVQAVNAEQAETFVREEYEAEAQDELDEDEEFTDEFYVDAIIEGDNLKVRFDSWGDR